MTRVLAISSSGGHWEQLMLLRPVFDRFDVSYTTTSSAFAGPSGTDHIHVITDCNRNTPWAMMLCLCDTVALVWRLRPEVIVTTGAAPGLVALFVGRLFGARTVWIDSIANLERLSLSGRIATRFATATLTQWRHLARPGGAQFIGSVL